LLIIGDTILDRYVACDALGMSAEAPVLVVKELDEREYIGGAAVVASHAQSLGAKCHYLSVVGDDEQAVVVDKLLSDFNVDRELIPDNSRPTTYKTRYMVENQKLFRVSRLQDHHISKKIEDILIDKIRKISVDVDGIIISDFVYGVITDRVIDVVKEVSECNGLMLYGDLQCSSQVGKVTKFREFNFIAPTEKEARIALDDQDAGIEWAAKTIMDQMLVDNMLMKLGSDGFIAYERVKNSYVQRQHFPAISVNPVDVTGAGDSLLASMTVCLSSGANLMEASAIGACMASLAVQEVGNVPITHEKLSRYIEMIMK